MAVGCGQVLGVVFGVVCCRVGGRRLLIVLNEMLFDLKMCGIYMERSSALVSTVCLDVE